MTPPPTHTPPSHTHQEGGEKFITHVTRLSGKGKSRQSLKLVPKWLPLGSWWVVWSFMVGRTWDWNKSSHACGAGCHWFEHPAGPKSGSTQAFFSSCPDVRQRGRKWWDLRDVSHQTTKLELDSIIVKDTKRKFMWKILIIKI